MTRSRRALLVACAFVLTVPVVWSLVGDLSFKGAIARQDLDYLLRAPMSETAARWLGAVSAAALAGLLVRTGRYAWPVLLPAVAIGGAVALAGRVITSGGTGAPLGQFMVLGLSPLVALPLCGWMVIAWLAFDQVDRKQQTEANGLHPKRTR